jgi:hypothetical protein
MPLFNNISVISWRSVLLVEETTINQTNQTYVPENENSACKNMKMFDKKLG